MNKPKFIRLICLSQALESRQIGLNSLSSGFTLLELLIVVVITGILAAIAVPAYVSTVDKFRYGEAKIQMECMANQLKEFRMEKGYFPGDQSRDIVPTDTNGNPAIDCFLTQASGKIPFKSKYDYDRRVPSANSCYIQIVFIGKDGIKDVPSDNTTALYPQPGLYQYSEILAGSDDLVFSLGTNPMGYSC